MKIKKITNEFINSDNKLKDLGTAVSIFGGARARPDTKAYEAATEIAFQLGMAGFSIITGGGPGIMEAANIGAKNARSESVGLVISLPFEAVNNQYIDDEYNVKFDYFFPRKVAFVSNSDAFVIMPGGLGTLDELFEVMTLIQCKKIRKRPIVLFDTKFWSPLHQLLVHMANEGTVSYTDLQMLYMTDDIMDAVKHIKDNT